MAHFAELDNNNIVLRVVVVADKDTQDDNGDEVEAIGMGFLKGLYGLDTFWKKTSYNDNLRFRYAGIGYRYDETLDAFIAPKEHESWVLNTITADWEPPIAEPVLTQEQEDAGNYYEWDEDLYQTDNVTGWVLNTTTEPPIAVPVLTQEQEDAGYYYEWDEDLYQTDNVTGWVLIQPQSEEI